MVTKNREHLFGQIKNGQMILNYAGENAYRCWVDIPKHFPHVMLDEFIIMPNHVHGIIFIINKPNGDGRNEMVNKNIMETQIVETQYFASLRYHPAINLVRNQKIWVRSFVVIKSV
jgi:REP element-mobilizing transposase RayT